MRCSFHSSVWCYCFTEERILHWKDCSTNTWFGHWFSSPAHLPPSQCGRAEPCSCLSVPSHGAEGNTLELWGDLLSFGVMQQHTGTTSIASSAHRYPFPFSYSSTSSSTSTNHQSSIGDGHFSKYFEMLKVFFFRRMKTQFLWLSARTERMILGRAWVLANSCYLIQGFRSQLWKKSFSLPQSYP